jgi:hypothetical protein
MAFKNFHRKAGSFLSFSAIRSEQARHRHQKKVICERPIILIDNFDLKFVNFLSVANPIM